MGNNKLLQFSDIDKCKKQDEVFRKKVGGHKTCIKIYNHETGELDFEGSNKVILPGSAFTAAKQFNLKPPALTPSYNQALRLENSVNEIYTGAGIRPDEIINLFAVGLDGCGIEQSQVYDVDYSKWIKPEDLVPFRYQYEDADLPASMRQIYHGRQLRNGFCIYNFKSFDSVPVMKQQYTDGTPIDENIYLSARTDDIETFVELKMSVTKDDCRDFFKETVGLEQAKISSISLLSSWEKEIDGYVYHQDIRPVTKYHFSSESLIDLTKGIDIIYQIYY